MTQKPEQHGPRDVARRPKRAYSTPRLVEYGSIAKLTQGTRTNGFDAAGGGHSKNCL